MKRLEKIEIVKDKTSGGCTDGFITLKRYVLRNRYADGTTSREYNCDLIIRRGIDAVGVVLYSRREDGGINVYLVKTLRPAVYLRPHTPEEEPFLEEIVAGIIEPEDESLGEEGIKRRAVIEAEEEAGFEIKQDSVFFLGGPVYPTPGTHTERLYLVAAEVDESKQKVASKDGSVYEEESEVVKYDLFAALLMCEEGKIKDAKTEIALYRLARKLLGSSSQNGGLK